jgi:2-polyprenyl-3-methyl-5-hydroxy-6-metoxy-1,4-benzoquinol methylase
MKRVPLYDNLAADYDHFVDWDQRLAHELPFFECLFGEHEVRQVLDVACGTGHHVLALAQRGYQVLGTDLSRAMIDRARANAAALDLDVAFEVAGFGQMAGLGRSFDAVLCLGNSLPHLLTEAAVDEALADLVAVLRPGGVLVMQNRNFDRVWARQERFMPPQSYQAGEEEQIFVRFYDFQAETITFHMIRLQRAADGWEQQVQATELRPILADDLTTALGRAGFGEVMCYGGYEGKAFDPEQSGDLVTVAKR